MIDGLAQSGIGEAEAAILVVRTLFGVVEIAGSVLLEHEVFRMSLLEAVSVSEKAQAVACDVVARSKAQTQNVESFETGGLPIIACLVEPRTGIVVRVLAFGEGRRVGSIEVGRHGDTIATRHDLAEFAGEVEAASGELLEECVRAHQRSAVERNVAVAVSD